MLAPTLAERKDIPVVNTRTMSDISIIMPPHFHIYLFWILRISIPAS